MEEQQTPIITPAELLAVLFTVITFVMLGFFLIQNVRETMLYHDTLLFNVPAATAGAEGRPLTELFNLLIAPFAVVHRNLFSRALSAIGGALWGWDLRVEIGVMVVLQMISVASITWLAVKSLRREAVFVMALAATVLLSLTYGIVWLVSGWTMMFVSGPLMALGLALLFNGRDRPGPFIAVLMLLSLAVLSDVRGLVLWPLLTVGLWFTQYRRRHYLIIWLAVMVLSLGSYFLLPGMAGDIVGTFRSGDHFGGTNSESGLRLIMHVITFTVGYLGNNLLAIDGVDVALGLTVITAFSALVILMLRAGFSLEELAPWVLLGLFSLGSGALTAVGRVEPNMLYYRPVSQYMVLSLLSLFTIWRLRCGTSPRNQYLIVGILLIGLLTNDIGYTSTQNLLRENFTESMIDLDACYRTFPVNEKPCFTPAFNVGPEDMRYLPALALNRLGIYRHISPQNVLPAAYQPGAPIVVNTRSAFMTELAGRWYLAGTDDADILYATDADQQAVYAEHPFEAAMEFGPPDPAGIAARGAAQVWYLTDEAHAPSPDMLDQVYPGGWIELGAVLIEGTELTLYGYASQSVPE